MNIHTPLTINKSTEELRAIQQGEAELPKEEAAELAAYAIECELAARYQRPQRFLPSGCTADQCGPTDQSKIRIAA